MQRVWSTFETLLRRYPWVLTLLTLIPCAYFAALGTNHLLVSSVLKADVAALSRPPPTPPPDPSTIGRPTAAASATASFRARDTDRILRRNVFDAQSGCLNCAAPEPSAAGPDTASAQAPVDNSHRSPEPCSGQARITGAVQIDDPLWSFAFLSSGANQPALPFRVGQPFDGKTVSSVGWHQQYGAFVLLREGGSGGAQCFYSQIMPPRPPAPVAAAPAAAHPPAAEGASGELAAALDQGIERAGANEFNVRRGVVDRILENQAELMRTTRIVPHQEGGRTTGVQMFGVRGNSLLGRLGMQNGDVLNRINGLEIASPDRALEAYSRLRTSDHITISVTRNGQPVNIDFNIR